MSKRRTRNPKFVQIGRKETFGQMLMYKPAVVGLLMAALYIKNSKYEKKMTVH